MTNRRKRALLSTALFTCAAALGFILPTLAHADDAISASPHMVTSFEVDFTGSLFIFPLGKLKVSGAKDNNSYFMRADMETAGLGKLAKDQGLWSTSKGYFKDDMARPIEHIIQKLNEKAAGSQSTIHLAILSQRLNRDSALWACRPPVTKNAASASTR